MKNNNIINWRKISVYCNPTDDNKNYLVTDGIDISTTAISVRTHFKGDSKPTKTFIGWDGDENTYEDNSCCSGTSMFDLVPTHWCPTDEINLPK